MIFIALDLSNQVCGYARVKYHNQINSEPSGWYQMGIVIKDNLDVKVSQRNSVSNVMIGLRTLKKHFVL
jgi:hypothetical protein